MPGLSHFMRATVLLAFGAANTLPNYSTHDHPMNKAYLIKLEDCLEYMKALTQAGSVQTMQEMFSNAAYVYLSRAARVRLAWEIIKTIFR